MAVTRRMDVGCADCATENKLCVPTFNICNLAVRAKFCFPLPLLKEYEKEV